MLIVLLMSLLGEWAFGADVSVLSSRVVAFASPIMRIPYQIAGELYGSFSRCYAAGAIGAQYL